MKTIGNILWVVLAGVSTALGWLIAAALLAMTIVGLPFARQCVKLARFTLWPFGRTTVPSASAVSGGWIGNGLWFIFGIFIALGYAIGGVLLCVTIIGIPFGIQSFKFVPLALFPFGKEVIKSSDLTRRMAVAAETAEA